MNLKTWIVKYKKIINDINFILPDYASFELLSYELWIISILVLTKTKKKDFDLSILKMYWLRWIEKNKKKTSNWLNQYCVRFKIK